MAEIRCPMCSKPNPEGQDTCQFCQARLTPLESSSPAGYQPGDEPTPKSTSELEPILPEWLRQARQEGKDSAEEFEELQAEEKPSKPKQTDRLARLKLEGTRKDNQEDIPDWLSDLRPEISRDEQIEETFEDAASANISEDESQFPTETPVIDGKLPGWLSSLADQGEEDQGNTIKTEGSLDWLNQAEDTPPQDSDQDFLSAYSEEAFTEETDSDEIPVATELPDWLGGQKEELELEETGPEGSTFQFTEDQPVASEGESSVPDWIQGSGETQDTPAAPFSTGAQNLEDFGSIDELPDWISSPETNLEGESPVPGVEGDSPAVSAELPDWLAAMKEEPAGEMPSTSAAPFQEMDTDAAGSPGEELPDWLSFTQDENENTPAPPATKTLQEMEPPPGPPGEEIPDWMSDLPVEPEPESGTTPLPGSEQSEPVPPAFAEAEPPSSEGGSLDDIFSVDVPDWLTGIDTDKQASPENKQEAGGQPAAEDLSPVNLPSWVQAMRPVESAIPDAKAEQAATADQFLEKEGPLAGLSGVLPAAPTGFSPSGKPKVHSIKIQADEGQRSHAALLDKILETETRPEPISSDSIRYTQRVLRWVIAGVMIFVLTIGLFSNGKSTPLPAIIDRSKEDTFFEIIDSLPNQGSVLLVTDYEAAYAGELEAIAEQVLEAAMFLKNIRITLISTYPTGPALGEKLIEKAEIIDLRDETVDLDYTSGNQYVNLGYIPGGLSGIHSFTSTTNMTEAFPVTSDGLTARETIPLQAVHGISDFTAIIVLTSSSDSAQLWIEQITPVRSTTPLLIIGSAQSEPVLLPYVNSGQVSGMINGLQGSSQRYRSKFWDAYCFGLLTATLLIVIGSIWNLIQAVQDRRKYIGVEE
ncbi:MAG: hypothetical protein JXA13_13650 [Anaerolineales bacterium]|nr:hypothetical protein [Anaerolineales bacterium]